MRVRLTMLYLVTLYNRRFDSIILKPLFKGDIVKTLGTRNWVDSNYIVYEIGKNDVNSVGDPSLFDVPDYII